MFLFFTFGSDMNIIHTVIEYTEYIKVDKLGFYLITKKKQKNIQISNIHMIKVEKRASI